MNAISDLFAMEPAPAVKASNVVQFPTPAAAKVEPVEVEPEGPEGFYIGQPLDLPGHSGIVAYVAGWERETGRVWSLGGGDMQRQHWNITTVSQNNINYSSTEGIARPMAERAVRYGIPAISADEVAALMVTAQANMDASRKAMQEAEAARLAGEAKAREELARYAPAGDVWAVVATLEHNDCDSQTDYYNVKSSRRIVLGWSKSKRANFAEYRKAALNHPDTAELATEGKEHREDYSGGGGLYLKIGGRYSDGWSIQKRQGGWIACEGLEFSEAAKAGAFITGKQPGAAGKASSKPKAEPGAAVAFTVTAHTHTKKGFAMWIAAPAAQVERETFSEWLSAAKAAGGWYSRAWAGTPAGFAFKDEQAAHAFAAALSA